MARGSNLPKALAAESVSSVRSLLGVSSGQTSLGGLQISSAMMLLLVSCAVDVFVWRHFMGPLDKDDSEQRKLVAAAF